MQSYSSPYTGAFNPNTGDKTWDQNLSTIGSVLFPDQSKIAQAYHYGSEARKAQIESNRALDQMAAGHAGLGMQFGLRPNPTYQSTPFGTIMNDPYENYGATQGPTAPPATQGPTAPPATQGPTAPPAPPGAPVAPAQAPSTLGAAITQLPPEALSRGIVAGVENNTSSGTLPPMAPATAVSGPEPTTTTSNGMSPQNAPRNIQPLSVTSAGGGGRIYAPPGASDGTPSPVNFNFGQYVGLLVQSGMPFQAAQAAATATLGNMAKNGQMSVPLAENLAAFMGAPTMRNQVIANEGSANVANIQAAASIKGHQIQEAGAMARTLAPTTFIPDPDPVKAAQGVGSFVPLGQQQGPGGYRGTNPAAVAESVKPVLIQPGGAATPPQQTTAGQAQASGAPVFQGLSKDQQAAQLEARIQATTDPEQKERLIQQYRQLQALPREIKPEDQRVQQAADYEQTQRIYSAPQKGYGSLGIANNAAFDNDAETAIERRAFELSSQFKNRYLQGDPVKARAAAINDLMKTPTAEGFRLPTPAEVAKQREGSLAKRAEQGIYGDTRLDAFQSPLDKAPTAHMMIRLVPKDYKAGAEPGKGATAGAPAAGAPAAGAPAAGAPAAVPPAAGAPAAVPPAPTTALSPVQMYGGTAASGATPSPSLIGRINQGVQAIGQAGRAANPEPLSSIQMYGSQPAAAGVSPAPAAPTQMYGGQSAASGPVSGGAPRGALGPAPAGSVEGQTGRHRGTGQLVVNRGGWLFPQ